MGELRRNFRLGGSVNRRAVILGGRLILLLLCARYALAPSTDRPSPAPPLTLRQDSHTVYVASKKGETTAESNRLALREVTFPDGEVVSVVFEPFPWIESELLAHL